MGVGIVSQIKFLCLEGKCLGSHTGLFFKNFG